MGVVLAALRRRQHDIGVPRARGPSGVMQDDGLRPSEGVAQPVEIMTLEREDVGGALAAIPLCDR
jgi:hypothetical protein